MVAESILLPAHNCVFVLATFSLKVSCKSLLGSPTAGVFFAVMLD